VPPRRGPRPARPGGVRSAHSVEGPARGVPRGLGENRMVPLTSRVRKQAAELAAGRERRSERPGRTGTRVRRRGSKARSAGSCSSTGPRRSGPPAPRTTPGRFTSRILPVPGSLRVSPDGARATCSRCRAPSRSPRSRSGSRRVSLATGEPVIEASRCPGIPEPQASLYSSRIVVPGNDFPSTSTYGKIRKFSGPSFWLRREREVAPARQLDTVRVEVPEQVAPFVGVAALRRVRGVQGIQPAPSAQNRPSSDSPGGASLSGLIGKPINEAAGSPPPSRGP